MSTRHDARSIGPFATMGGACVMEEEKVTTNRRIPRALALVVGLTMILGACGGGGSDSATNLTTIALPHDWCNYGAMLDGFTKKTGIKLNELNPNGGSGDEIEAIKANKTNKGPQAPDVIDVGISFGDGR